MHARWLALVAVALLAGCGDDEAPRPREAPPLVSALQEGGLVLVFRHAITETRTDAQEQLGSCARQRNLTDAGRRQARRLGEALRALRVPVNEVRASPFCRTRETAELAFGRARTDRDLTSLGTLGDAEDDDRRVRALRRLIGTPPPGGRNRVLVTHTPNLGAATGLSLEEGEAAVFRPLGGRRFRLLGRVPAERWDALRRQAGA